MPTPPSHQRRLANVPLRISYGAYGDAAPAEADVGGDEQADAAVPDATEVPDAAGTEALKHTSQEMTGATDMDDPRSWLHNGAGRAMMMRAGWVAADFGESRQMRVWPAPSSACLGDAPPRRAAKPAITVACPWTNASSCNHHFMDIAATIAQAIEARGGKPMIVAPPVITDGLAMGHKGMRYSLARSALSVARLQGDFCAG